MDEGAEVLNLAHDKDMEFDLTGRTAPPTSAPDTEVSEAKKFENDGAWFGEVARYIVNEFYNPPIPNFTSDLDAGGNFGMLNTIDDMLDSYAHYFGHHFNRSFFDYTKTSMGKETISKFLPRHTISKIMHHIEGNCTRMIKPIGDSISAKSLSRETNDKMMKRANKIRAFTRARKELEAATKEFGLEYDPGVKKYDSEEEAESDIKNFKDEYEILAADVSRGLYHQNRLATKFLADARHSGLAGGVGVYINEEAGKILSKPIIMPNAIWDYRATDDYMTDAMISGFVEFMTPSEVFSKFPKMDEKRRKIVTEAATGNDAGCTNYRSYYNNHRRGLSWWNVGSGQVTVANIFFLARTDIRMRLKETKYGVKYPQDIDNDKEYDIDGQKIKGSMISGDFKVWMVHKVCLIGNDLVEDYGYYPYQVQASSLKQMPQMPVKFFAHRFMMGYFRSIVSRVKGYNQLMELYEIKIQQKVARDKGVNHVFDEQQFGENESVLQMNEDFEKTGLSGINRSKNGGQGGGGQDFMTKVDMSMQAEDIAALERLIQMKDREIDEIVGIPPMARGQQNTITGKTVQENTVTFSTLSQASFYEGLMEFWRRELDYATNLHKLYVLKSGKADEVMPISDNGIKLLKFTRGYTNEELMIFIALNDSVEGENKRMLMAALQAYNQNPELGHEALLNTMTIMKHNTFEEGVQYLERYSNKKKAEYEAAAAQKYKESTDMMKMQQAAKENADKMTAALGMLEKLANTNLAGAWQNVNATGMPVGNPDKIIAEATQAAAALMQTPTSVQAPAEQQPA